MRRQLIEESGGFFTRMSERLVDGLPHGEISALLMCAREFINPIIQDAAEKAQILLDAGARFDIANIRGNAAALFTNSGSHGVVSVVLGAGAS